MAYLITLAAPPRRVAAHWLDPAGNSGRGALPAQAGGSRQGQYCFFGRFDGAADGGDHHLPADCAALLLGGVEVSPWDIAQSLIVMMLIPLAIGLFINARYEDAAAKIQPTFGQASNIAILVLTVLGLVLNFKDMIALVGSWGILAGISLSSPPL